MFAIGPITVAAITRRSRRALCLPLSRSGANQRYVARVRIRCDGEKLLELWSRADRGMLVSAAGSEGEVHALEVSLRVGDFADFAELAPEEQARQARDLLAFLRTLLGLLEAPRVSLSLWESAWIEMNSSAPAERANATRSRNAMKRSSSRVSTTL